MITWLPSKDLSEVIEILEPEDAITSVRSAAAVLEGQGGDYLTNLWAENRKDLAVYGLTLLFDLDLRGYKVTRYRHVFVQNIAGAAGWCAPPFVSNSFCYTHKSMLKYLGLTRALQQHCVRETGKPYSELEDAPPLVGIMPRTITEMHARLGGKRPGAQYSDLDVNIQKGLLADSADNPDTKEILSANTE